MLPILEFRSPSRPSSHANPVTIEEIVEAQYSTSAASVVENRSLVKIGLIWRLGLDQCRASKIPVTLLMPPWVDL
jgi:hypothetical protein